MSVPIRTNDIVRMPDGTEAVVTGISITADGPVLKVKALVPDAQIVHADEVELADETEKDQRVKAVELIRHRRKMLYGS